MMEWDIDVRLLLTDVASGVLVSSAVFATTVTEATKLLASSYSSGVCRVSRGDLDIVVIGPVRGHACDLAAMLLDIRVPQKKRFIFLGNLVDGGAYSVEAVHIALTLLNKYGVERVTVLRGAHEQMFPTVPPKWIASSCSFNSELRVRMLTYQDDLIAMVMCLFRLLPVMAIVDDDLCLVAGGISPLCPTIKDVERCVDAHNGPALLQLCCNKPMDDDDAFGLPKRVLYAESEEFPGAYDFSFTAAVHFLNRNGLKSIVRGNHYTVDRHDDTRNQQGRPWHYHHSSYDPGYRLYRAHPVTHIPTVISLFSAPGFCGVNRNLGAVLLITKGGSTAQWTIQQFHSSTARPLQLPGSHRNAFSWSLPLMWDAACLAVVNILTESDRDISNDSTDDKEREGFSLRVEHFATLCVELGMPLPNEVSQSLEGSTVPCEQSIP